jgi:metal-sulfur cluster biosynthetic enzyme
VSSASPARAGEAAGPRTAKTIATGPAATRPSAACLLTAVLESQIAAGLAPLGGIEGFRIDWQWIPAWSPADVSGSGRDQLRAIGFTI